MSIESTWKRIAVSGPTTDGRNIEKQWLRDIAETYSANECAALLWFNHERNYGDDGKVLKVKLETDDKDRLVLFAKFKPSSYLMRASTYRTLFASIEVSKKNFAGSGKRYLLGLGITDEPGSLGVDQLAFSKKDKNTAKKTGGFEKLDFSKNKQDDEVPSWFKKHFPQFFENKGKGKPNKQHSKNNVPTGDANKTHGGDDLMNEKQYKKFMKQNAKANKAAIAKAVAKFNKDGKASKGDSKQFKKLSKQLKKQDKSFAKLAKENKTLLADNKKFKKKFEKLKSNKIDNTHVDDAANKTEDGLI